MLETCNGMAWNELMDDKVLFFFGVWSLRLGHGWCYVRFVQNITNTAAWNFRLAVGLGGMAGFESMEGIEWMEWMDLNQWRE